MDKVKIKGVILTPLKKIYHPKGDILHGIKKIDKGYLGFGEAYFSTINYNEIKGWNRHKRMTLNLIVPMGEVIFVIYDERKKSAPKNNYSEYILSPVNYQRLTVPPDLWLAFKGKGNGTNLILNIADIEHDSAEIERLQLDKIAYNWSST